MSRREAVSHLQWVFTKWCHTPVQIISHLIKVLFASWKCLYLCFCFCLAHDVLAVEACVEACDHLCRGALDLCTACGSLGLLLLLTLFVACGLLFLLLPGFIWITKLDSVDLD